MVRPKRVVTGCLLRFVVTHGQLSLVRGFLEELFVARDGQIVLFWLNKLILRNEVQFEQVFRVHSRVDGLLKYLAFLPRLRDGDGHLVLSIARDPLDHITNSFVGLELS